MLGGALAESLRLLVNGEGAAGVTAAIEALRSGCSAIDAVEKGIRPVEDDPQVRSVGRGGIPNLAGEVECDASIMEGHGRQSGSVAGLQQARHAITVARAVMEMLPHAFLAGTGALQFAREIGAEMAEMLTPEARVTYEKALHRALSPTFAPGHEPPDPAQPARTAHRTAPDPTRRRTLDQDNDPCGSGRWIDAAWRCARHTASKGTTIFLVRDRHGHLAGGTSSSGWPLKYPGRVGDSAVIGAGLYVDDRYGACACTHTGEMTIRCQTASRVVHRMEAEASVEEACRDGIRDLHQLREGLLGPVAIHAMDRDGRVCVMSNVAIPSDTDAWYWVGDGRGPERIPAKVFTWS